MKDKHKFSGSRLIVNSHISANKELFKCFDAYISKVATYKDGKFHTDGGIPLDVYSATYIMPNEKVADMPFTYEQTKALTELYSDLRKAIKIIENTEYEKGLNEGKRALMLLNSGKLSLDDFDKNEF